MAGFRISIQSEITKCRSVLSFCCSLCTLLGSSADRTATISMDVWNNDNYVEYDMLCHALREKLPLADVIPAVQKSYELPNDLSILAHFLLVGIATDASFVISWPRTRSTFRLNDSMLYLTCPESRLDELREFVSNECGFVEIE